MKTVLVTGSNGQLANCIKDLESQYLGFKFIYTSQSELDITNTIQVDDYFNKNQKIDWCINCAAYTAVDKAESDKTQAFNVNELGPENLANNCKKHEIGLIHISTDFVFDGNSSAPYKEEDSTNPLGVYGQSKLCGENKITSILNNHFIIRTSWLYCEHGNNFLKTMLRLSDKMDSINVVDDQFGTPTYAKDLAKAILDIIVNDSKNYGLYHYSNEGAATWYDFAKAIFDIKNISIITNPIPTENYPTPAKRPNFSVLNKSKIKTNLDVEIPYWRDSLKQAISKINE